MTDWDRWSRTADRAVGTAMSVEQLADESGLPEEDIEHELAANFFVQVCPGCGWWAKTQDPDGFCEDCNEEDG